jgi:hypothetical protein
MQKTVIDGEQKYLRREHVGPGLYPATTGSKDKLTECVGLPCLGRVAHRGTGSAVEHCLGCYSNPGDRSTDKTPVMYPRR